MWLLSAQVAELTLSEMFDRCLRTFAFLMFPQCLHPGKRSWKSLPLDTIIVTCNIWLTAIKIEPLEGRPRAVFRSQLALGTGPALHLCVLSQIKHIYTSQTPDKRGISSSLSEVWKWHIEKLDYFSKLMLIDQQNQGWSPHLSAIEPMTFFALHLTHHWYSEFPITPPQ